MKVSVIVVTFNEEKNILACLHSLLQQRYRHNYEILVVDGGSQDKTKERVQELQKEHKNLTLLVKDHGYIAACRNIGIRNAQYDYVAFTDADCIVPEDWLERLTAGFKRHAVAAPLLAGVGGANIPPENATHFQRAIGIAFDSLLGSLGSIQARRVTTEEKVFSISCSNSLYKKAALEAVDSFSEELGNQGEDWDMGAKLQKKGYMVYGIRNCLVWHNFRATPAAFWKNMVFYGVGRMRLTQKHPDFVKPKYMLPLFFIPLFVLSIFTFLLTKKWLVLLPFLYFPFIFLYGIWISLLQRKVFLVFHVFLVFLLQHFGYALGEWKGLRWFLG